MSDRQIIEVEDYQHAEEARTLARVSQHPIVVKLISAIDSPSLPELKLLEAARRSAHNV